MKSTKLLSLLFIVLSLLLNAEDNAGTTTYCHRVQAIDTYNRIVTFDDGSTWTIGWWYGSVIKNWQAGDRLKVTVDFTLSPLSENNASIDNLDKQAATWGVFRTFPSVEYVEVIGERGRNSNRNQIVLRSGWVITAPTANIFPVVWRTGDQIYILNSSDTDNTTFDIWNLTTAEVIYNCSVARERIQNNRPILLEDILTLESRLNERVIAQRGATQSVSASMLNYYVGLKNDTQPIGVFLFLGPTGVGKTELAKVLTEELYKTKNLLLRFDMGNYSTKWSEGILIGSGRGYVDHERGGALTEALKAHPQSVVLLDEIEKADPSIRKIFLPVFDEGIITDGDNNRIPCKDVIFIMTSNLCGEKIARLSKQGYSSDDILAEIESELISELSPELYNRVECVVFHPLDLSAMDQLVDHMLAALMERIAKTKSITLLIDKSVKLYLMENGYHSTLGARPMKKLIEKQMLAAISTILIKDQVPQGATVQISIESGKWIVNWSI